MAEEAGAARWTGSFAGRRGRRVHGRDVAGPCRRRGCAAGAIQLRDIRDRRTLQSLSRTARGGARGRRQHPLSLASCLFRSAHRRSDPRAGAEPAHGLAGRAGERPHLRPATARAAEAARQGAGRCTRQDRDRRRRRGGLRRGRNAEAAGFPRQHRDAERRYRSPGRSAQSVKGLSRRQRAGGLVAAAPGQFLQRAGIDIRLKADVTAIDTKARHVAIAGGGTFPTTACCWRPAPSRCGCRSRAPISRMFISCGRWPIAGRSSLRPKARAAPS